MNQGISYYKTLFTDFKNKIEDVKHNAISDLEDLKKEFDKIDIKKVF